MANSGLRPSASRSASASRGRSRSTSWRCSAMVAVETTPGPCFLAVESRSAGTRSASELRAPLPHWPVPAPAWTAGCAPPDVASHTAFAIRVCPSRSVPPIAETAVVSSARTPSAAVSEAGSAVLFDDPGGTSRRYPIQMPIYALDDDEPQIDELAYVAPDAGVIGRVTIGPQASIWPCAVLRGDHGTIAVGARTSIQDGTVVHTTARWPTAIGDDWVGGDD